MPDPSFKTRAKGFVSAPDWPSRECAVRLQHPVLPFLTYAGDASHLSQRFELIPRYSATNDAQTPVGQRVAKTSFNERTQYRVQICFRSIDDDGHCQR